jgi:hypothetical protein
VRPSLQPQPQSPTTLQSPRPITHAHVRASTENFALLTGLPSGPAIAEDTKDGAALRLRWWDAFDDSRGASSSIYTDNLLLSSCYEDSPLCVGDGSASIPLERPDFIPTTLPGERAPGVESIAEAARSRGVPLRVVDIGDPEIAALYEKRLVFVRPDGHVAWRGDDLPFDLDYLIDHVRGTS